MQLFLCDFSDKIYKTFPATKKIVGVYNLETPSPLCLQTSVFVYFWQTPPLPQIVITIDIVRVSVLI